MDNSFPPFYVGQKVAAINDTMLWKKGDVFIIQEVKRGCCDKVYWLVYINLKDTLGFKNSICSYCGDKDFGLAFDAKEFTPIIEGADFVEIELTEVLEREIPLVGAN